MQKIILSFPTHLSRISVEKNDRIGNQMRSLRRIVFWVAIKLLFEFVLKGDW